MSITRILWLALYPFDWLLEKIGKADRSESQPIQQPRTSPRMMYPSNHQSDSRP